MAKVLKYTERRNAVDAEWLMSLIDDKIRHNIEANNTIYANTPAEDVTEGSELELLVIENMAAVWALGELKAAIEKELETLDTKEFEEYV